MSAPLTDSVIIVVAKLFDDARATREPSHSEIEFQIKRANLELGDPTKSGPPVGKAKRIRNTLSWGLENSPSDASKLTQNLIALLRGCGGFRASSQNFVGAEPIANAIAAFRSEGFDLTSDGEIRPLLLDVLTGAQLTDALHSYIRRAKRGATDAALVTGTGKDLLEATAAHVIVEIYGSYPQNSNFAALLGQAFVVLGFATPLDTVQPGEASQRKVQRSMFELACAINTLRNKEGTGHGRPWVSNLSDEDAKAAVEFMGTIAEFMLRRLGQLSNRR